jgi:hypothetical protein
MIESSGGWCVPGPDADFRRIGVQFLGRKALLQLAKSNGLRGYSNWNRRTLVERLQAVGVTHVLLEMDEPALPAIAVDRGGLRWPT